MDKKIGFIGLGIMGMPMARNLMKAGFAVTVYNRTASKTDKLVAEGAKKAGSPKEAAEGNSVIITIVSDTPDVGSVILGESGVIEGVETDAVVIDMSTISPQATQKIAERIKEKGAHMLDAPVSGGEQGAIDGTLSIMVGGSQAAFDRALPVFEKMGKNIIRIGEAGSGQVTKACNQIVVGMTIQAMAEALNLAKKAGVDVAKVRNALLGGLAQSRILDVYGQRFLDRNFKPGFKINLHRKDMNIALQTGKEHSVPLPGAALVATLMDALIAQDHGGLDHSALALLTGKMSGME